MFSCPSGKDFDYINQKNKGKKKSPCQGIVPETGTAFRSLKLILPWGLTPDSLLVCKYKNYLNTKLRIWRLSSAHQQHFPELSNSKRYSQLSTKSIKLETEGNLIPNAHQACVSQQKPR